MYNKRVLTKAVNELDTPKAPVRKNSNAKIVTNSTPIISSEGYKQGPPPEGTHYRILGNKLYNPTPYPITAVSDNGITKTLQPYDETNVDFPGASYVDEFTAKKGGSLPNIPKKKNSKGYSRSLEATNKLFAQNPLTKKPKSRKRKIFDPNSKYYQIGGINSPVQLTPYYSFDQPQSPEAWQADIKNLERQLGNPVQWTMDDHTLMQNKLNDYKAWRETTPEGQAVIDYHNEPNEYVIPIPYHLRNKQKGGNFQDTEYYQIGGEAAYIDLDLTDEEIEVYRAGGYVVEELPKAQTGIQKGVACDTDRCEETDKIQEILDDRDRAITDSLKIDNRIAEQVWNEDVSAEKLFNQIGIKSANQQLNTLAPNCSNYGTGSLRCIDPSINTEHTLSNYRFNKAVKENKTPFELVGTYKGVGNIPPEILQRGDLVSELYNGHGHMIKYTGTNNGDPAYLHSTGSKDSWEKVHSPEDWMTHTTHVYRYHPDEMDKIPMLEEMARTNPTYYIPGKMPLRPAENISQNNLNTLDLGNTTFKYGGLPKAQSGLYKLTQSLLKPFSRTTTNLETLQLPKLSQLELELPEITLPKYGMTDLEKVVNKAAPHYVNRATDPRNFERAAALDAEYGTNYVQGLKELQRHLDETSNIGELPLNIKIEKDPDDGSGGYSGWTDEGKMKNLVGYPTSIRDRKIVLYDNTDPSDVRRILPHEGKHHYTMAIPDFYSNAWGDFMSSTLEPLTEINKTNPAFADKLIKPAFKGADYSKYEYFEKPQEIDAYINTNLRDQLVDEGILEHHWDTLDDSKVAEFLMSNPEKHSKAYLDLLKSKDFINMFNKGVYAIPAAIGVGAMSQDYKAGGEYKLGDTVDKAKMRELEKLGYTLEKVK